MIQGQQNCSIIGENWSPLVKPEDLSSIHKTHRTDQLPKLSYALHMVEERTDQLPKHIHIFPQSFFKKNVNLKIVKFKIPRLWTIAKLIQCFPTHKALGSVLLVPT